MENNKCESCSCGHCSSQNSCGGCGGGACRSINHHSVIRILVGVIVLMVVLFAGFKMGMFFNRALDGGCGYSGGSYRMMNRDFDGSYGNKMMLRGWVGEIPTATGTAR